MDFCKYICILTHRRFRLLHAPFPRPCRIVEATCVRATPPLFVLDFAEKACTIYYVHLRLEVWFIEMYWIPSIGPYLRCVSMTIPCIHNHPSLPARNGFFFWLPTFFHGLLLIERSPSSIPFPHLASVIYYRYGGFPFVVSYFHLFL